MANAFIAMCYAAAKKAGVDTSKMSPDEVVEWYNEHNKQGGGTHGGGDKKQELKQAIEKAVSDKAQPMQEVPGTTKNNDLPSTVDMKDANSLKSSMKKINDWLANQKEEHAVVIDKDGKLWESKGDENSVFIPDGVDLDGAIVSHNHLDPHSFGEADIMFMKDHKNTEFRLVDKDFTYKAKFIKDLDMPYNSLYLYGLDKAYQSGDCSKTEDFIMEYLKEGGYVDYEKSVRNT